MPRVVESGSRGLSGRNDGWGALSQGIGLRPQKPWLGSPGPLGRWVDRQKKGGGPTFPRNLPSAGAGG